MNKSVSIIRVIILLALSTFAIIFLFGEEQGDSAWTFLQILIDKGLAIGVCYLIGKLYKRWSKVDPWLIAYDKMCDEVMEAPNPAYIGKDNEE